MKRNKKGFTIVELVIVIAVIAILSAILIPTFVNLTDKAQKSALQSDLASAYSMYTSEAADGVVDEHPEVAILLKKQTEVALKKGGNYYEYKEVDGKETWATTPMSPAPTIGDASGNVQPVATNYYTFGGFEVYYKIA